MTHIKVTSANWEKDRVILRDIRENVFIKEQGVPQELEWDELDQSCEHFIAYVDNEPAGCARLTKQSKIGRMAVLRPYRKLGIGKQILDHIKRHAAQKRYSKLELSAQCHALNFYQKCGFSAYSLPYDDAGIPHIDMVHHVFAQEQTTGLYSFLSDTKIHHGNSALQAHGFLDIMLSQARRNIILCLKDLSHPICSHPELQTKIKLLARENRHFKVYILLNRYDVQNNEHPLFRLQDRLPSFIEIRTASDTIPCQLIMDNTAWLDFELNESRACYSDQAKIKHFMERFNRWWHNAHAIADSRRLSI